MLQIKNIKKDYLVGEQTFSALKGINLSFRKQEFVSILGQSGSGKTTLLNIIGGLDRYTSGDLVIDDVSTKNYKDKDWDAYRNHRIGFVFQNYNLIPHLDVLSNVELAQTLSGVTKEERQRRAREVLVRVGLEEHLHKRPNQLSGGQQQRVSIARALVNNPSIILADEPTGALDSETSVDIMNLLTEISKDKLIIMVTHNGELAKQYSNRIVTLKDGLVTSDSNPYEVKEKNDLKESFDKSSMSFFTAMRLSFKNLLTKKFRTLITAFAGSIGIIGVALVLSLQYGFTAYLDDMEQGTFAGLPIQINRSFIDINAFLSSGGPNTEVDVVEGGIEGYEPKELEFIKENTITQNYIDYLNDSDIVSLGYGSIVYNYGIKPKRLNVVNGTLIEDTNDHVKQSTFPASFFEEYFDIVSGSLYQDDLYEAVLIVDKTNRVPNSLLKFLGLIDENTPEGTVIPFDEIIGKEFKIFGNNLYYNDPVTEGGQFTKKSNNDLLALYNTTNDEIVTVKITGILKTNSQFISTSEQIAYSTAVKTKVLSMNINSRVVEAQRLSETSVVQGVIFYETPMSKYTKDDLLDELGGMSVPTSILIYPKNFDSKEHILDVLDKYNELNPEEQIGYSDNVAAAVSMIKDVMTAISAVLIAFSAISLVVSSVMIGIITYTSVLERTKEIGVLRSIGARKKDISRVFNAESILIGLIAGLLGVVITYGLVPIINIILENQTGSSNVAQLYIVHAAFLILISVFLTFIAGLIPSKIAARKDPVVALRTE
ncbi:ATP-binding cassette domain-containing protein [Acholeplasma hippikon]|uniref:ABC transporter ATP-binding protein n=1 Tax=Acholeplasma hippikon TaxID=264636 RepID=A0A449BKP9_9MOLU|nr:ABC transporter ATP-binding protein/permease [Acholeplasma hippikon]VEU83029.1 ABC transporter ATP-binding protein [Acholeplasma hippikon]